MTAQVMLKEGRSNVNVALKAISQLTRIDVQEAAQTVRRNPLLDEEIHIDEELINLEEAFNIYKTAGKDLRNYPHVRKHMMREQYFILKHTIGLVCRMM